MGAEDAAGRAGLTRAQLLARGGGVGLALLGAGRPLGLGGDVDALAATAAPPQARHFVSRPDLRPPVLTVRHRARGTSPGYLFIAPSSGPGQRGALIFDETGEPVWFHPVTPVTATAFRASTLRGKPVLTWWEGTYSNEGLGRGVYVVVDDSYRQVARIHAGGYRDGDLHEFLLTDEGTALVTKNEAVRQNLSAYGGAADGLLYGGVVQEIAVPSGRVLFEWRSLDHVELSESHARPNENHFDYFHVNSVDVDHDGHLLVSARNTWAVYKVHRRTGEILWRLGGRKSDFAMGPGTITAWQHDARSHDRGRLISIFDNGAAPQVQTQSRGLLVRLDTERMRATLVRTFKHRPNRIVSKFMGSVQLLPDGGAVMGWGSEPFVTEFDRAGRIRFEALLPDGGQNYRAFRFPWIATPVAPPVLSAGVVRRRRGLFASWNGSTEVRAWQLRYGATAGELQDGGATPRSGFETFLERPPGTRFAQVIALDAKSRPIGRSRVGRL